MQDGFCGYFFVYFKLNFFYFVVAIFDLVHMEAIFHFP